MTRWWQIKMKLTYRIILNGLLYNTDKLFYLTSWKFKILRWNYEVSTFTILEFPHFFINWVIIRFLIGNVFSFILWWNMLKIKEIKLLICFSICPHLLLINANSYSYIKSIIKQKLIDFSFNSLKKFQFSSIL